MTPDTTPLARLLARRRRRLRASLDVAASQRATLRHLLRRAAETRFGRAHGFAAIDGVASFQRAVPLRDWEAFWREWWRAPFPLLDDVTWPGRIRTFAETSGTTSGRTRHVPVSRAMIRANRSAALSMLLADLDAHPRSRLFSGAALILGGSTDLRTLAPGVRSGDLSGIAAATIPLWAAGNVLPSRATALLPDWNRKLDAIVAETVGRDLRSISGTPSWLAILFERLLAAGGAARLDRMFPDLKAVIHGGVGIGPYRARFERLLGPAIRLVEAYAASEGFIAHSAGGGGDLELVLGNGLFYEFVPVGELGSARPTRHWLGDAIEGVDYALVLASNAGLFGYVLGDVVRITDRARGRIVVAGRTAHTLSGFGEHVSGGELDRAIERAARATGCAVTDYAAAIRLPDDTSARGGHIFAVECDGAEPDRQAFASVLDETLAAGNDDYAAHRRDGTGMLPPEIRFLPAGRFAAWMRARGRLGGQNKVPRVLERAAMDTLLAGGRETDG